MRGYSNNMEDRDNPQLTSDKKAMGIIYLITCNVTHKMYVGQTTKTVHERWQEHIAGARRMAKTLAARASTKSFGSPALYRAMARYGVESFTVEDFRTVPLDALDEEEQYWIGEYETLAPKGYNLTAGGDRGVRSIETRAVMSASRERTIDRRRSEKLEGMPMRFTYRNYATTGEQIVLLKHPLCASKCFSVKQYGSFEAAKKAALEFHAKLEVGKTPYMATVATRRTEPLPKGMYCVGNGYGYSKTIQGVTYRKQFSSTKVPKEENKRLALEHLTALLQEHEPRPQ